MIDTNERIQNSYVVERGTTTLRTYQAYLLNVALSVAQLFEQMEEVLYFLRPEVAGKLPYIPAPQRSKRLSRQRLFS